jgi:hypothetical protein
MNFQWLSGVNPLVGTWLAIGMYVLMLAWVVSRKGRATYRGGTDCSRWRDLRLWTVPVLLLQVWLYWLMR